MAQHPEHPMRRALRAAIGMLLGCTALCIGTLAQAHTAGAGNTAPPDSAAPPPPQRGKARKPRQHVYIQTQRSSSQETPAQRDQRLYRECQGRPNAGACAGYTQKPPARRGR